MSTTFANRYNLDLLDENYARWKQDPDSVDKSWSAFFEGFELGRSAQKSNGAQEAAEAVGEPVDTETAIAGLPLETRVEGLVYSYRTLGHTIAKLDPLSLQHPEQPLLSLEALGFTEEDLDRVVSSKFYLQGKRMKLRE